MSENIIIIMAGGLGKRMNSNIPKVLHKINGKPLLVHIIEQAFILNPLQILIVVGKYKDIIEQTLSEYVSLDKIKFILQAEALGTGHAIQCCRSELLQYPNKRILILSGDTPLIQSTTINDILSNFNKVKVVTTILENPYGYGRILEQDGAFVRIVEEKDCNSDEKKINKVNCGIYAFDSYILYEYLPLLQNNNSQKEYYLTDIIELIKKNEKIDIDLYNIPLDKQIEIIGVNTQEQLDELEKKWSHYYNL